MQEFCTRTWVAVTHPSSWRWRKPRCPRLPGHRRKKRLDQKTAEAEEEEEEEAQQTTAAPDFTVYDAEGNPVQLSEYFGKPLVLNFWSQLVRPLQE